MTEQVYPTPLSSFKTDTVPTPVFTVPIMAQGAAALEQINEVCLPLQVFALQHRYKAGPAVRILRTSLCAYLIYRLLPDSLHGIFSTENTCACS